MPCLTILRALLAWWIVVYHAAPVLPFGFDQQNPWLRAGSIRVDCFFVVSGFVLFNAYPGLLERRRPGVLRDFYVARFARIYPLHFVMLCAFAALIAATHLVGMHLRDSSNFTIAALIEQIFLLNGTLFPGGLSWNFPSWTLSAEVMSYLAAPLLFLAISRLSKAAMLPALLTGCLVMTALVQLGLHIRPGMIGFRVLMEFSIGAMLCRVTEIHAVAMSRHRGLALLAGLAALAAAAATLNQGCFFAAALWMIGFLSLRGARHQGVVGRIEKFLLFLGDTSFGVYICHAFVLLVWIGVMSRFDLGFFSQPVPAAIILCATILGLATLLNRAVEGPAREWIRKRLSTKRSVNMAQTSAGLAAPQAIEVFPSMEQPITP